MSSDDLKVAELRSLVSTLLTPYYDTDFNLRRWIQAFPGVPLEKIARRLRHHLLFRACAWEVDTIRDKAGYSHPLHKHWPITFAGVHRGNCLVLVEQSGFIDYEGIHDNFSLTDIIKAKLSDAEEVLARVMQIEKETGEQAQVMLVIDSDGVGYSKKLIDLMMGPMQGRSEFMLQHYVELVDKVVIVNLPSWAYAIWTMVKPLLPERSREKMKIRDLVDPSMCPAIWNDERYSDFGLHIERPPKVPAIEIIKPGAVEKVHVKAGRVAWLEYEMEKGDAMSIYVTGDSGFGFTVVLAEHEDDSDVHKMRTLFPLIPWTHGPVKVPIQDTVVASETGLYKVWFSNMRAWWSSVTIRYSIEVIKRRE